MLAKLEAQRLEYEAQAAAIDVELANIRLQLLEFEPMMSVPFSISIFDSQELISITNLGMYLVHVQGRTGSTSGRTWRAPETNRGCGIDCHHEDPAFD